MTRKQGVAYLLCAAAVTVCAAAPAVFLRGVDAAYFGRQQTLCHRDTVLHIDGSHVRVCSLFEIYGYITGTRV